MEKKDNHFEALVKSVKEHELRIKHLKKTQYYAVIRVITFSILLYFILGGMATGLFNNRTQLMIFIASFFVASIAIYFVVKGLKLKVLKSELKRLNLELYAIMKLKEDEEKA